MENYFKVDTNLLRHRKVLELADRWDCPARNVAGLLISIWSWASRETKDGNVTITKPIIKREWEWDDDPNQLLLDLCHEDSNFLEKNDDGTYYIHGWDEHQGALMENRERKRLTELNRRQQMKKKIEELCIKTGAEPESVKPRGSSVEARGGTCQHVEARGGTSDHVDDHVPDKKRKEKIKEDETRLDETRLNETTPTECASSESLRPDENLIGDFSQLGDASQPEVDACEPSYWLADDAETDNSLSSPVSQSVSSPAPQGHVDSDAQLKSGLNPAAEVDKFVVPQPPDCPPPATLFNVEEKI